MKTYLTSAVLLTSLVGLCALFASGRGPVVEGLIVYVSSANEK